MRAIAYAVAAATTLASGAVVAQTSPCTGTGAPLENVPVATLELERYLGQWHEIAHLPMFFQRKCVSDTTATYTLKENDRIEVRNACGTKDGSQTESVGEAKTVDGSPGALKVRFAPAWLGWVPGIWADYWVLDVDPDYRWAVVGGPSRKYLWILSRDPGMDAGLFNRLKSDAEARGYDLKDLVVGAPLE
ncbi:lipocalin family protein [Novilysobacter antarcticus]|uniref:lipocalin family protein n=1 Tax=Novilysobacter antarcticus TaxID=2862543 RepID=UPI001C9A1F15